MLAMAVNISPFVSDTLSNTISAYPGQADIWQGHGTMGKQFIWHKTVNHQP